MALLLGRWFDLLCTIFFITHIPTTVLVDIQSIIPRHLFPAFARDLLDWHILRFSDTLVQHKPPWFVAMVWGELLFQLPFFFLATYAFLLQRRWIRIPALVYGVHTATTLIPILGHILAEDNLPLAAIYSPFLIMPALLALKMALMPDPFPYAKGAKQH